MISNIRFSLRPDINYKKKYSTIMDAITFQFLIGLKVLEGFRYASHGYCYDIFIYMKMIDT